MKASVIVHVCTCVPATVQKMSTAAKPSMKVNALSLTTVEVSVHIRHNKDL